MSARPGPGGGYRATGIPTAISLTAVYEMSTRPIIHGEKSATSRLLADADDGLHRRVVKTRNVQITLHTHGCQSAPTRTVRAPMVHHDVRRSARYV